jgi:hypothetical protein
MQGRLCRSSGQRCAHSTVLHVPNVTFLPNKSPGRPHNGFLLRLHQAEPASLFLGGSEALPSGTGPSLPGSLPRQPGAVTSQRSLALRAT